MGVMNLSSKICQTDGVEFLSREKLPFITSAALGKCWRLPQNAQVAVLRGRGTEVIAEDLAEVRTAGKPVVERHIADRASVLERAGQGAGALLQPPAANEL